MSNILDFTDGLDTGEADEDSIQPIENGEDAVEEVFNRPHEIIRERTEKLRAEAGYRRWVDDADRSDPAFILVGAGGVTWNGAAGGSGDGYLVIDSLAMVVFPFYGAGLARSDYWEAGGGTYPSRFAHFLSDNGTPGEQDVEWVSKKYAFEGGNDITLTVTGVAGYGATTVVVSGSNTVPDPGVQPGQDDIVVTYDSTGGVGVDDIISDIAANAVANQLLGGTYALGNSLPVGDPAYDIPTTKLSGGIDTVFHNITAVELDNFFGTDPLNPLREGDTLAIWYETPLERRRSIEETAESDIPAASLVNLTTEPDKAPNAVIIGRVLNDEFYFVNGIKVPQGANILNISNADSGNLSVDASTFTHLSTLSTTQQEVNEDIDSELAIVDNFIDTIAIHRHASLTDLINNTAVGDPAYLDAPFATGRRGSRIIGGAYTHTLTPFPAGAFRQFWMAVDGLNIYMFDRNDTVEIVDRENFATAATTITDGVGSGIGSDGFAVDGQKIVFSRDDWVQQYNLVPGGASTRDWRMQWSNSNPIQGVAIDGSQVFVVARGGTGAGSGVELVAIDRSTTGDQLITFPGGGEINWSRDASSGSSGQDGPGPFGVCVDDRFVYVYKTAAALAPAVVKMQAFDKVIGSHRWNTPAVFSIGAGTLTQGLQVATNGDYVVVADAGGKLAVLGAGDGVKIVERDLFDPLPTWGGGALHVPRYVTCDDKYIYAAYHDGLVDNFLLCLDFNLNMVWGEFMGTEIVHAIASDGDKLFIMTEVGGPTYRLIEVVVGRAPRLWQRVADTDAGRRGLWTLARPANYN
jgi:hypothetical protein